MKGTQRSQECEAGLAGHHRAWRRGWWGLLALLLALPGWAEDTPLLTLPAEVALGVLPATGEIRREVPLTAIREVVVERALSSCPCVSVSLAPPAPVTLAAGQQATLTLTIDPSSYAGAFRKTVFLQVRPVAAVTTSLVRLSLSGQIGDDDELADPAPPPPAPAPAPQAEVVAHTPELPWTAMRDALVLFLAPECDRCNWVRLVWLPRFRQTYPLARVYTVDVATEHGLRLLLQVEELTQAAPHQEAPIAWTEGRLHHGTAAIAALLPPAPAP